VIPRPGIHRPPRRHLRLATRGRSPPRTAVGARVAPPADDPANASPDDRRDQLLDASLLPSQPLTAKVLRRPVESALAAPVRVMHQPLQLGLAVPDGHLQGVQGQVSAQRPRGLPAHDEAAERIDDEGHVDEPRPGRHIGQIRNPQPVGSLCGEVAIHQVGWPRGGRIGCGGPVGLATNRAPQPQLAHEALHRAAGDWAALAVQLPPHLAGAIDPEVVVIDPADLSLQPGVADRTSRRWSLLAGVVGGRGDRQQPADRLDPKPVLVTVDVGDHLAGRRSSSAPKKAAADFRISLARRNSLTSRSSVFSRSRSPVVSPGRRPSSVSARRTHLRSVSAETPNLYAIEVIAAHCEACSSCAQTPA